MYWPFLPTAFETGTGQAVGGSFVEALYFSGTVGTTLGFGDLLPTSPAVRLLAIGEAMLGLGVLTGVVTYLMGLIGLVVDRNLMAFSVHGETGGDGDGVGFVARVRRVEGDEGVVRRLDAVTRALRIFCVRTHHYPIVHLFFRSGEPVFDCELALRTVLEAAIAASIASRAPDGGALREAAAQQREVVRSVMRLIAADRFHGGLADAPAAPGPAEEDLACWRAIAGRLALGPDAGPPDPADLALIGQARAFLDDLDRLTRWRRDHARPAGWAGLA